MVFSDVSGGTTTFYCLSSPVITQEHSSGYSQKSCLLGEIQMKYHRIRTGVVEIIIIIINVLVMDC